MITRKIVHPKIRLILITTQKETDLNTALTMPRRKKLHGKLGLTIIIERLRILLLLMY